MDAPCENSPSSRSVLLLLTSACKAPEESHSKAILGAVLIDGAGGPPLTNSIVRDSRRPHTRRRPALHHSHSRPGRQNQWRRQVSRPCAVTVPPNIQGRDEAAFAKAHEAGLPAIGRIATLADAEWMLDHGATAFVGMIRDTETLDPEFLAKLRDLRIAFAPALTAAGAQLDVAKRNTLRLFQAGVPIALAAEGARPLARGRTPGRSRHPAARRHCRRHPQQRSRAAR